MKHFSIIKCILFFALFIVQGFVLCDAGANSRRTCDYTNGAFVDYVKTQHLQYNTYFMAETLLKSMGIEFPIQLDVPPDTTGFVQVPLSRSQTYWIDPMGFGRQFLLVLYRGENTPFFPILIQFESSTQREAHYDLFNATIDANQIARGDGLPGANVQYVPTYIDLVSNTRFYGEGEILEAAAMVRDFYVNGMGLRRSQHYVLGTMGIALEGLTTFVDTPYRGYPLFPGVYPFNSLGLLKLLEFATPKLKRNDSVLVLGSGTGFDAVGVQRWLEDLGAQTNVVHAVDVSPVAVANGQFGALALMDVGGIQYSPVFWKSDLFGNVKKRYKVILFHAPDPMSFVPEGIFDFGRWDEGGRVTQKLFAQLPRYLTKNGYLLMFARPETIEAYLPRETLEVTDRLEFVDNETPAGIFEIRVKKGQ